MSKLEVIAGPMYSGKSKLVVEKLNAYAQIDPFHVAAFQPSANERDDIITSRAGISFPSLKTPCLSRVSLNGEAIVGIDEAHMYDQPEKQVEWITSARKLGKTVVVSCLDNDYMGNPFPVFEMLLDENPDEVHILTANCMATDCTSDKATKTVLYRDGVRQRAGQTIVVDGATEDYRAYCETHF